MASELSIDIRSTTIFEELGFPKLSDAMSASEICDLTAACIAKIVEGDKENKELQQKRRAMFSECAAWVAAHFPSVANLTSAEGHWEVSTPWFLEWMGLMGARNWLADIIDGAVSNERAAKEFDKLTDLITGAQRDGSGWCRHVSLTESKAGLRRVGTYCGRAVRGDGVVCAAHGASDFEHFLVANVVGFPEEVDRDAAPMCVPGSEVDMGRGTTVGCMTCARECSVGVFEATLSGLNPDMKKRVGIFLLVPTVDELDEFLGADGPPVVCSTCLACDPLYVMFNAFLRELASGRDVTAERVRCKTILVFPSRVGFVPKAGKIPASMMWGELGLPREFGFGAGLPSMGMTAAERAGLVAAGERSADRGRGVLVPENLRRREHHAIALGAVMGVSTETPAAATAPAVEAGGFAQPPGSATDDAERRRMAAELLAMAPTAPVCPAPGCLTICLRDPVFPERFLECCGPACAAPARAEMARKRRALAEPLYGAGAVGGEAGATFGAAMGHGGSGAGELSAVMAKVLTEVADLKAQLAAGATRGPLHAPHAASCELVLRAPPAWDPSSQSVDIFGFPVTSGGHRLHPNRHSHVDFLGIYSVTMPEANVMKAYGAACAAITRVSTRVDRGPVDAGFPLAPGGTRESILMERELVPGVAIKTGVKALKTPEAVRYGEYLDGLHAREWAYFVEAKSGGTPHGTYRRAQSRYLLVAIQFGRQLLDHLSREQETWTTAWTFWTQVVHLYLGTVHFTVAPSGLVHELMLEADEARDEDLRTLTASRPALRTMALRHVEQLQGMLVKARAVGQKGAHVDDDSASSGGGGGGFGGGGQRRAAATAARASAISAGCRAAAATPPARAAATTSSPWSAARPSR